MVFFQKRGEEGGGGGSLQVFSHLERFRTLASTSASGAKPLKIRRFFLREALVPTLPKQSA